MPYLLAGSTLALDATRCTGCGRCVEVCPHEVFTLVERRAAISSRGDCMQCGACRMNCPEGAIAVESGVGCAQAIVRSRRRGGRGETECSCG
jgi:ferredoxin